MEFAAARPPNRMMKTGGTQSQALACDLVPKR